MRTLRVAPLVTLLAGGLLACVSTPKQAVELSATVGRDLEAGDPFSAPSPTLVQWLDQGTADASAGRRFWRATYDAAP